MISFYSYLKRQTDRNDVVGRFSKDVMMDECAPKTSNSLRTWLRHLEMTYDAADWAMDGCRQAFMEYCNL